MKRLLNKLKKLLSSPVKGVSGYSLTELSISTSIIAVMAVGGLSILGKKNEADKVRLTKSNLASIETAIKGFIRTKGYVPCPALPALLETNVNFGKSEGMTLGGAVTVAANYSGYNQTLGAFNTSYNPSNKCSNNGLANETGAVPVRTLGLPDSASYDGWGRKFIFRTASASGSAIDFGYPNFKGNIAIVDLKGIHKTTINDAPPFNDGAIYVLISHGANGKNVGYARNVANTPSQATGVESKNTDHTRPLYIQDIRSNIFDDMVSFGTLSNLGRQKIIESPIRIPDIACQNAQTLVRDGRSLSSFNTYAQTSTYSTNADTIFKSATILSSLCQNRNKNGETTGPTKISGLQLWMDANDSAVLFKNSDCTTPNSPTLIDSDTINCWKDKSGQRKNATGGGGAIYNTNIVNGRPSIRFNGNSNNLYTQALDLGQNTTFCAVVNPSSSVNQHFFDTTGGTPEFYIKSNSGALEARVFSGTTDYGSVVQPAAINLNHIMCYIYDNSATALATMYVEGSSSTSVSTGGYSNAGSKTRVIGSYINTSNYYNGYISEIVAYSKAVSTSDRNKIEEYLSEKWGIPLATSTSTATCPVGLVFQKTTDDPQGSCKCPNGQNFSPDLVTANACMATPDNSYFGKCMIVSSAPDYNSIFAATPTVANSPDKGDMALWLDANDCSTIILNNITTATPNITVKNWKDKSGLGNNAIQNTYANQPLYITNALNSMPVLRFDGVSDFMTDTLGTNITSNNLSYFIVWQRISRYASNERSIINFTAPGATNDWDNTGSLVGFYEGNAASDYLAPNSNGGNFSKLIKHPGNSSPIIASSIFDGTNNTSYINGVGMDPAASSSSFNIQKMHIAARWTNNSATNYNYNGDVAEIIVYKKALTSKERTNIETYLSTKWNIIRYPDHNTITTPIETNLKLWLDANDAGTIYKDSGCFQNASAWDSVGCWADKSGLATPNNATQSTASNSPTYAPGSMNGMPTLLFNSGLSQSMSTSTNGFPTGSSARSSFVVVKTTSLAANSYAFYYGTASTGQAWGSRLYNSNFIADLYGYFAGGNTGLSNSVPYIFASVYASGSIISEVKFTVNGTVQTYNFGSGGVANTVIGTSNVGSGFSSNYLSGNISEYLLYDTNLTDSQRLAIERYLGMKWGITVN